MSGCAASVRFAVLADVHVSPGISTEALLSQAVDEINGGNFDFVLVPGDVSNSGMDCEFEAVKRQLDRLLAPCLTIPGNHDTNWSPSAVQGWYRVWGRERIDARVGDWRIVGFSTGPYMKMGYGFVRSDDLSWLEETLKKHQGENIILMAHYPLIDGLGNWQAVLDILHRYPVSLAVGGHVHENEFYDYEGIPGLLSRALHNQDGDGYGIVTITDETISFEEKLLGEEPQVIDEMSLEGEGTWRKLMPKSQREDVPALPDWVREIWRDPATVYTGVALNGEVFYYGTSEGKIKAVDWKRRMLRWEQIPVRGQVYSTPVYSDGMVMVGSPNDRLMGLNAETGQTEWTVDTESPVAADGVVANGAYYVGDSTGNFLKVEVKTGQVMFRRKVAGHRFQGRPLVEDGVVYVPAWDNHVYALDATSGEIVWAWDQGSRNSLLSPGNSTPVKANGRIFVCSPDRHLNAFDALTGRVIFRNQEQRYRESMGLSADGRYVYAKTMDSELVAVPVDSPDGTIAWKVNLGWGFEYDPCPILEHEGRIYLGSLKGTMAAVEVDGGHAFKQARLGCSGFNRFTPVPAGGVLVSVIDGGIFRIGGTA